jgi:hypothetical protein
VEQIDDRELTLRVYRALLLVSDISTRETDLAA